MGEIDKVVARPFKPAMLRNKSGRGSRRVLQLNKERYVNGVTYQQVLIPYTPIEMRTRRLKHRSLAPFLPDEPNVEGVDYNARPQMQAFHAWGHLQFVREDRLEKAKESSPWAG